jgi:hypothetical protein
MRAISIVATLWFVGCSTRGQAPPVESAAIAWMSPLEIAEGGGQRGAWRQNASSYDYVDDGTVSVLPNGTLAIAWVDQRAKEVLLQAIATDGSIQRPVHVSRSPAVFSWLPRIASNRDDIYVLWQEIVFSGGSHGGDVFFARSRDGGASFEAPHNLSSSRNGDGKGRLDAATWSNGSLDLAVGADGTIVAAWTEFDGPLWIARSVDRGESFSTPRRIDDGLPPLPARAPTVAIAPDGTWIVAWTVGDDPAADLRIAASLDRGETFSPPSVAIRSRGHSDAPKLGFDSAGTLHLVWSEASAPRSGPATIRHARSRDRGRTFEAPRELSAPSLAERNTYPMLAVDGEDVVVSWELGQPPRGLGLVYSGDGGATFTTPVVVPHSTDRGGGWNGSHQGQLMEKLALRDGLIAIAQSALAHGNHSRVWLLRGRLPVRVASH